jgi:hypothetical protein
MKELEIIIGKYCGITVSGKLLKLMDENLMSNRRAIISR